MMDVFIRTMYGDPPPPKRGKVGESTVLAGELLLDVVSAKQIAETADELSSGTTPYLTHDLAVSVALKYFKDPVWIPKLGTAQLMARVTVLEWFKEGKVARLFVESFEDVLYKTYKR